MRGVHSSFLHKNPDSCRALFEEKKRKDYTFRRQFNEKPSIIPGCPGALFEFCWLMTDHVSFEWALTSYNQVISCKQFGGFFLDRWEVFVLHSSTKTLTAFKFIECWLMMSYLNEVIQCTTRSSALSNSVTFSRQMRGVRSSSCHKKFRQLSSTFWILLMDDWSCSVWKRSYKLHPGHQL